MWTWTTTTNINSIHRRSGNILAIWVFLNNSSFDSIIDNIRLNWKATTMTTTSVNSIPRTSGNMFVSLMILVNSLLNSILKRYYSTSMWTCRTTTNINIIPWRYGKILNCFLRLGRCVSNISASSSGCLMCVYHRWDLNFELLLPI